MSSLEEWQELENEATGQSVTTEQLDQVVAEFREIEEEYQEIDAKKKEAYKRREEAKQKVLDTMQKAGKSKYYVEGLGTVYEINKYLVQTPKTLEDKEKFFAYLKENYGDTFLMDKLGVHSATLNKIYNEALNEAKENGEDISTFHIPGLDSPNVYTNIGFRKEKK